LANWGVEAKTGDSKPRVVTARIGTQVYRMAVYDQTDIVSNEIARLGSWEKKIVEDMLATLETLGVKGSSENNNNGNNNNNIDLLDIGGNIGWFSFALARHGFRAVAFEPFRQNRNLMKLTACLNPATAPRVTVYRHGLGEKADECELLSWVNHNQGNGVTRCRSQHNSPGTADYTVVDNISVRRFDDLLRGDTRRVNLLKIDTEGFELYALRGAVDMFSAPNRRPFALYTEFAPRMLRAHSADPADYLAFIKQQGLFCDDSQAYLDSNYAVYLKEIDARGGEVDLRCTRKL
jgi:FkbM family methyltransferase